MKPPTKTPLEALDALLSQLSVELAKARSFEQERKVRRLIDEGLDERLRLVPVEAVFAPSGVAPRRVRARVAQNEA